METKEIEAILRELLDEKYSDEAVELNLRCNSLPMHELPFDGRSKTGKVFFGKAHLGTDEIQVIEKVWIVIGGKRAAYDYKPDTELGESFWRT